ncbi:tRNA (adenosine(37)-N6)-dimethylallyltransferase MiaA [Candidatus Wolfebacteria bacterium]|nr:tRNA (adenosine(37)-N6)-dimethylallyltransferase MiaA [Candidatus Wolfebacteria bacterium]
MSTEKEKPKIIVILGPTASGKSDLAVKIALRLGSEQAKKLYGINGAEIISADSRQVYKELDIGSGKVPRDKNPKSKILNPKSYFYKGVPHHLLDVARPKQTFTVSRYQKLAEKAINKILAKGKIPIICGGTGLYIDSVIYDIKFPEVPPQPKLRKQLEKKSTEELFKQLQKLDPRRAENIDKRNRRRLIRALEICAITKKAVPPLNTAANNGAGADKNSSYKILKIGVKKPPEKLKKLIEKRLLKRLKTGMIEEVKKLRDGSALSPEKKPSASYGISWKRLDNLGLEYRYVSRYLRGLIAKPGSRISACSVRDGTKIKFAEISLPGKKEMIESLKREIWRYAKRQMTWFKKDPSIHWVSSDKKVYNLTRRFLISGNNF